MLTGVTRVHHRAGPVRSTSDFRAVEHRFEVPLAPGDDRRVELFAREVRSPDHADEERPYLVMLNGGPGSANLRPERPQAWLARALRDYHVVLLDQRGTGLSSPVTAQTLPRLGADAAAQADTLKHFRADAIVRDAEHVRRALLGDERWSTLGQSFGGFITLTYLSFAPEGVTEAFITAGVPSLHRPAEDVYRATYRRLEARLDEYFARYPDDRAIWEEVVAIDRRHQALGMDLGMIPGLERLHYLAESAFAAPGELSAPFLEEARRRHDHTASPLFAVLHEAIYAQGRATAWAAQRVLDERGAEPLLLTEMVLPWHFEAEPSLRPFAAVAELLAHADDWPALYDPAQLARNEVPVVAAIYSRDVYVESAFSLETAEEVRGMRTWVSGELHHDGIHMGPEVLDRLIRMRRDEL